MKITKKKVLFLLSTLVLIFLVFHFLGEDKHKKNLTSFNKSQHSTAKADSLWVVINKARKLPSDYAPAGLSAPSIKLRLPSSDPEMSLRHDSGAALAQLFEAAKAKNLQLMLASGYRSYDAQQTVYISEVVSNGQSQADKESARPGYSEHQSGLAADIEPADRSCELQLCFADTTEGKWLDQNSYKFGYVIRYQKNHEQLTGYAYEPWHIRFVGKELAAELHKSNTTMEQFFGLPTYTDYPAEPLQLD